MHIILTHNKGLRHRLSNSTQKSIISVFQCEHTDGFDGHYLIIRILIIFIYTSWTRRGNRKTNKWIT